MMRVRATGIIFAATVAVSLTGSGAVGQSQQQGMSALKGHNSNAPVDVTADRIEVQDRADRAIFAGNVHATQAELTLETARLTVAYSNKPGGGGAPAGPGGGEIQYLLNK
jgi:lipopolysaccharide export system protein LptA